MYQLLIFLGLSLLKPLGAFQERAYTPSRATARSSTGWGHHRLLRMLQKWPEKVEKVVRSDVSSRILLHMIVEKQLQTYMKETCQIRWLEHFSNINR